MMRGILMLSMVPIIACAGIKLDASWDKPEVQGSMTPTPVADPKQPDSQFSVTTPSASPEVSIKDPIKMPDASLDAQSDTGLDADASDSPTYVYMDSGTSKKILAVYDGSVNYTVDSPLEIPGADYSGGITRGIKGVIHPGEVINLTYTTIKVSGIEKIKGIVESGSGFTISFNGNVDQPVTSTTENLSYVLSLNGSVTVKIVGMGGSPTVFEFDIVEK